MIKRMVLMCMVCIPVATASYSFEDRVRDAKISQYSGSTPDRSDVIFLADSVRSSVHEVRKVLSSQQVDSHRRLVSCISNPPQNIRTIKTFYYLIEYAKETGVIDSDYAYMCTIHNQWGNAAKHEFAKEDCEGQRKSKVLSKAVQRGVWDEW